MHEKRIGKAYIKEMLGSLAIYTVLLLASITFGKPMADGVARTLVLASPMIGFGLAVWAIARHLRRVDEFIRQSTLEALAIAAGVTAGLSFTYGFLELSGFPRLSMFVIWPVMGATWGAVTCVRSWLEKRSRDE